MSTLLKQSHTTAKHALSGVLFGLCFPIAATWVRLHERHLGLSAILAVQASDVLLWIIDSAPFVLGTIAYLMGRKQENFERLFHSELGEHQRFLTGLLDNLPIALFGKDSKADFRFCVWNRMAETFWGIPRDQVIGRTDYDFFPKEQSDFFRKKDLEAMSRGGVLNIEEEPITLRNGDKKLLRTTKAPLAGRYLIGFSEDITARAAAEKAARLDDEKRRQTLQWLSESKKRLHFLFDHSPIGIAQLDLNLNLVKVNKSYADWLGYSAEELKGRNVLELTHPEDVAKSRAAVAGFSAPGFEISKFRKRYVTKAGATVWGLITSRAVQLSENGERYLFTAVEDITDAVLAEDQLKSAQAEVESFFSISPDLLCVADMDGHFRRVNPSFETLLGYAPDELLNTPYLEIVHPEDRGLAGEQILRLSKGELVVNVKVRCRAKDGGFKVISWTVAPDPKSRLLYASGRDLTAQHELEKKVAYASKMSSLGEMAAGVAHEINNPLTIIQGKANQMLRLAKAGELKPEGIVASLELVTSVSERIARIVRGLGTFSRDATNDPFELATMEGIVDDVLSVCSERFKVHGVRLETGVIPKLAVLCRIGQVCQVLINLLNNSYDAVLGLPEPWVRLEVHCEGGDRVVITVTDSGKGIPEAIADKLMQPFFTTKAVGRGTGLGLSISKGIVEDHGGTIVLDRSSLNTRFVVQLPILVDELAAKVA